MITDEGRIVPMPTNPFQGLFARIHRVFSHKKSSPADRLVFSIAGKQYQHLIEWQHFVDERVLEQELETGHSLRGVPLDPDLMRIARIAMQKGKQIPPWYGVSQGAYVYTFIPTTVGLAIKVENTETGDSIDLSDYSNW